MGLLHLGFKVEMILVSVYKEMVSVEKLVETHTEKHGQTANTFLSGRAKRQPKVDKGQKVRVGCGKLAGGSQRNTERFGQLLWWAR